MPPQFINETLTIIITLFSGVGLGAFGMFFYISHRNKNQASKILENAENEAKQILHRADETAKTVTNELNNTRSDLNERKKNIASQEQKLEEKEKKLDKKYDELEKKQQSLNDKEKHNDKLKIELETEKFKIQEKIEQVAKLTEEEARNELLKITEEKYEKNILSVIEKKKKDLKNRTSEISKEILLGAIQNYAGDVTSEMTQTVFSLESDDIKWKLIWKEWRNIIAFEKATGVSLIIDDNPDTVFLSSFDLFRRYIAKKSLEDLIADKRIQPARIEEIVEKNQEEAEKLIRDLGEKTVNEMWIIGIPEDIYPLIGKFRFRTSYGQNLLLHSKEVAYISRNIAQIIGADVDLAFKGGLLHDIGKAMDHDIEGTHPEIGGKIARKYWLDEKLTNIIEGHHDDVPQICIETKIIQIADAISAVRPGARRMNIEDYIKRVQEMESIAMSISGITKAFALSAGREVRVFVDANTVSDIDAENKAREIAEQIEANCSYPGEVKINLIREKRVIEYAK